MESDFVKIKSCKKVGTKHTDGSPNGWLLEIISDRDGFTEGLTGQAYVTVIDPSVVKGYHIHALARYHVTCIKGKIRSTVYQSRTDKQSVEYGEGDFKTIKYPPGCAHLIENISSEPAYIIIYRDVSWNTDIHEQLDIAPERIETEEAWKEIEDFCKKFRS